MEKFYFISNSCKASQNYWAYKEAEKKTKVQHYKGVPYNLGIVKE